MIKISNLDFHSDDMKIKQHHSIWQLVIIILIASVFRLVYLSIIPNAIAGDELVYPITARAVAQTGKDMTGTWTIWQALLFQYPPDQHQAELPYFLHLPLAYLPQQTLFTVHVLFAILSIGVVILLFAIAKKLLGERAGFFVGLVAAINPWIIVMGRTGYETTVSTFFYLLSLYLFLTLSSWNILWTAIPLTLAFYSYIATKTILIPFVFVSVICAYFIHKRKNLKQYLLMIVFALSISGIFFLLARNSSSRMSDIYLPNNPQVTAAVDAARKLSLDNPISNLLINKVTIYGQTIINKLLNIFSPSYLFADADLFFPLQGHGFFYFIDLPFLFLGLLMLFSTNLPIFFLTVLLALVGTIPHLLFAMNGDFSSHLSFLLPWLTFPIGYGLSTIGDIKKKWLRMGKYIAIGCIYFYSVCNFGYAYFIQHPLQNYGDFSFRVLSSYLVRTKTNNITTTVYSNNNRDFLTKYYFYANTLTKNGVIFADCPSTLTSITSQTAIFDYSCPVLPNEQHTAVTRLRDGGEAYLIFHDTLCTPYTLQRYPNHLTLSDFAVESLKTKKFCETFIATR